MYPSNVRLLDGTTIGLPDGLVTTSSGEKMKTSPVKFAASLPPKNAGR